MAINPANNPARQEALRAVAQANQDFNATQTLQGQLPWGTLRNILSYLPPKELGNAALTCRRWREAANGDHGVTLYARKAAVQKYLDKIIEKLDEQEYPSQVQRLRELKQRFHAMPPVEYRNSQTHDLIKREMIDILCEVWCDDLDQAQPDPVPLLVRQQDIIAVAKRTFKGDMSVGAAATKFTGAPMEGADYTVDLSGRSFVLGTIAKSEASKKAIETDGASLSIIQNREGWQFMLIRFPRSVDTAMLHGKEYGDIVEFTIAKPMAGLGGPVPSPLHLKLRLVRKRQGQPEDETLNEAVQRILAHPEARVDEPLQGDSYMTPEGHVYDRNALGFRDR